MTLSRREFLKQSSLLAAFPSALAAACSTESGARIGKDVAAYSGGTPSGLDLLFNQRFPGKDPFKVSTDIGGLLREAVDTGRTLRVLGGGHGYLGSAVAKDGLVVDMRAHRDISFDTANDLVTVQAGTQFIDLYRALITQYGSLAYVLPTGDCPTVGVAGYTLGGGYGHMSRRFGLMCDNVVAMTVLVVRQDGVIEEKVLSADSSGEDADLFWALRGAGGARFAVVKDFTLKLHRCPNPVRIYDIRLRGNLSSEEIERVLNVWAAWLSPRLDDPTISSKLALGSGWFHLSGLTSDSAQVRLLVDAIGNAVDPSFSQWDLDFGVDNLARAFKQCDNLDACESQPKRPFAARSAFLREGDLRTRFRAIAETVITRRSSPSYGGIELMAWRMKGGVNADNAFVHRHHDLLCQFYTEGMEDESALWMSAMFRAATSKDENDETLPGYQNYTDARIAGAETGFPLAYFPGSTPGTPSVAARLATIKSRYRNVFGG